MEIESFIFSQENILFSRSSLGMALPGVFDIGTFNDFLCDSSTNYNVSFFQKTLTEPGRPSRKNLAAGTLSIFRFTCYGKVSFTYALTDSGF